MLRFSALATAALAAVAMMLNPAGAGKPDYSGSYSASNDSGATSAEVTIDREKDGEWTIRLTGRRLPDAIERLVVQTVDGSGTTVLHAACDLDPALLRESCTARDVDLEQGRAGVVPTDVVLAMADSSTGGYTPVISFPLEQP